MSDNRERGRFSFPWNRRQSPELPQTPQHYTFGQYLQDLELGFAPNDPVGNWACKIDDKHVSAPVTIELDVLEQIETYNDFLRNFSRLWHHVQSQTYEVMTDKVDHSVLPQGWEVRHYSSQESQAPVRRNRLQTVSTISTTNPQQTINHLLTIMAGVIKESEFGLSREDLVVDMLDTKIKLENGSSYTVLSEWGLQVVNEQHILGQDLRKISLRLVPLDSQYDQQRCVEETVEEIATKTQPAYIVRALEKQLQVDYATKKMFIEIDGSVSVPDLHLDSEHSVDELLVNNGWSRVPDEERYNFGLNHSSTDLTYYAHTEFDQSVFPYVSVNRLTGSSWISIELSKGQTDRIKEQFRERFRLATQQIVPQGLNIHLEPDKAVQNILKDQLGVGTYDSEEKKELVDILFKELATDHQRLLAENKRLKGEED